MQTQFKSPRFGSWMPQGILVLLATFTLNACGTNRQPMLPDDPDDEVVTAPVDDGDSGFETPPAPTLETPPAVEPSEEMRILAKYDYLDPNRLVPTDLLKKAVLYYDANLTRLKNPDVLSVIDFSAKSTQKRFFIVDMKSGSVWNLHVAHGKGSDSDRDGYAEKFSNAHGSNASSLGFYIAAETYRGKHGLSLRLDGLDSTNSNARKRAVVIHGADYVRDADVIQGRSWGCPAIAMKYRDKLIGMLKGGSLLFAGLSKP